MKRSRYAMVIMVLFLIFFKVSAGVANEPEKDKSLYGKEKMEWLMGMLGKTSDSTQMADILKEIEAVSTQINDKESKIKAIDKAGVTKRNQARYFEALALHKKAYEEAYALRNELLQMRALNNIGVVYRRIDEYRQALDFHLKALKIAEKLNDKQNICISVNSIGNIYMGLGQYKEALECFNRSLPIEKERGNLLGVSINLNNIGCVYEARKDYEKALEYYRKSLDCNQQMNDSNGIAIGYNSIGEIYYKQNKLDKAEEYFRRALEINLKLNDLMYVANCYNNLANVSMAGKDNVKAVALYQKELDIALKIGSKSHAQSAYEGLSEGYRNLHNYEKAFNYYKASVQFADSMVNENNIRHVNLIHTQYESERKQQQIKLLEKEKHTSRLMAIISIIIAGFVIVVLVFFFVNISQKRKFDKQNLLIKEQQIRELQKDKQILASHAVLQGEETERQRLARDLHDGLGGMLSAVKLQLSSIKGNILVPSGKAEQFEKAIVMLDSSIKELRTVAHNMMPDALIKFGLKDALQDFCSKIASSSEIKVTFQYFGEQQRLEKSLEIALYRISQELINNVLKHAQASEVIIQLVCDKNRIHLTVQDNGAGFSLSDVDIRKSRGLQSIQARVESFNGRMDIASEPGKGTEVGIEFSATSPLAQTV
ncbi:MAG TPA: sensor histidine kinase [Bacteroidales bacterium]|nr:sensor histidine kinase [Bacteroidales bacterium]